MREKLKELRDYITSSNKFEVKLSTFRWFCFRYDDTCVEMRIIDAKTAVKRLKYDISRANKEGFDEYEKYT